MDFNGDAALSTCEIIAKQNATQSLLVPSMLDIIIKRNMPLKVQRNITGDTVVYSSIVESIGEMCDEYGSAELGFIASRIYNIDDIRHEVISYRPVPGVEIKVTVGDGFIQPVD